MRLAIIIGALALAGCAANAELQKAEDARASRELADALKDRVAGEPQDCISNNALQGPQVIDSRTILYTQGRRVWRNDLLAECPGLRPFNTLIVEVHGSQICRHDRFRAVEPGARIPGPYCSFGRFTPYERR